jgi:hypothetical protein
MNSNAKLNVIADLDLDPIKVKLMHKESGEGWSRAQVDQVEIEYRRFLSLMKLFPQEQVAPLFDVDIFWHYHILDTMKYAADCEQIFGYFLHHFPYTGLRGEDDEAAHERVGARMQELYEATFGEAYIRPETVSAATPATAYSMPIALNSAQNGSANAIGFAAGRLMTAYSMPIALGAAQNDSDGACAPAPARAKTAYSMPLAMSASQFDRGAPMKTAYSMPVATARTAYSMPVATAGTAYSMPLSMGAAQNDSFYTARPTLAAAA